MQSLKPIDQMRLFIIISLLLITNLCYAQKKGEFNMSLRAGMLLNENDVAVTSGDNKFLDAKNTFSTSLGLGYTKAIKNKYLLCAGIILGVEDYVVSENSELKFFTQIDLGIGYRFNVSSKFRPEIRLGNLVHLMGSQTGFGRDFHYDEGARPRKAGPLKTKIYGYYGGTGGINAEHVNYAYIGNDFSLDSAGRQRLRLGIQLQRQFIVNKYPSNFVSVEHYTRTGEIYEANEFIGKHTAILLVLGVIF